MQFNDNMDSDRAVRVHSMRAKLQSWVKKKHIDPLIPWLSFLWSQSSPAESHGCRGNKPERKDSEQEGKS